MKAKIIFSALALIASIGTIHSQSMSYSRSGNDAESLAAGSNAMMTSSAFAVSNNISLLPFFEESLNLKASYAGFGSPKANSFSLGAGAKVGEKLGIGFTASSIAHSEYDVISETGAANGTFKPSDLKLGIGAGFKIIDNISAGLSIYYLNETLADNFKYSAIASDLLVAAKFGDITVSGGAKSIGTKVKSSDGSDFSTPSSIYIGGVLDKAAGETGKIKAAVDADYFFEGGLGASLGAGYTWKDMVSARAGFRYGGDTVLPTSLSAGIGAKFSGIALDAAYVLGLGEVKVNTLCICLGYSF